VAHTAGPKMGRRAVGTVVKEAASRANAPMADRRTHRTGRSYGTRLGNEANTRGIAMRTRG